MGTEDWQVDGKNGAGRTGGAFFLVGINSLLLSVVVVVVLVLLLLLVVVVVLLL